MACSKVLVVEDDPLILMAAVDALRGAGLTVVEAETADEAAVILHAAAGGFDALFSDIETPGVLDGVSLAQAVGAAWPKIVIVLTSGRIKPAEGALPAGARFIGKPYDLDHVATMMADQRARASEVTAAAKPAAGQVG